MRTSESIAKISPALLKAQKSITFAAKDATNPHFKSKYADLPGVIEAIKRPLNDNGIVYIQSASPSDPGFIAMTTRLLHESGEWIEDTATLPLPKADPQGYGSASTYARRYGLAAITGLYQDDDDGNAASKPNPLPESSKSIARSVWDEQSPEQQAFLQEIADEAITVFKEQGPGETLKFLHQKNLDADEKVALFSRFDSKMRTAMKKEQAANSDKKLQVVTADYSSQA